MPNTPKTIVLNITEEDIRLGRPKDCRECPVANALHRRGFRSATVYGTHLSLDPFNPYDNSYHLPLKAQDFVAKFDAGVPVKPTRIRLRFDESTAIQLEPPF